MFVRRIFLVPFGRQHSGGVPGVAGLTRSRFLWSTNDKRNISSHQDERNEQQQQQQQPIETVTRLNRLVVDDQNEEGSSRFLEAVEKAMIDGSTTKVAINCRSSKLSRIGSIELGSICFSSGNVLDRTPPLLSTAVENPKKKELFLMDFRGERPLVDRRVEAIKTLLECNKVVKVMHDGRTSCDALVHLYGIHPVAVHDTSWCHYLETGNKEQPLNTVLRYHGLEENDIREKTFYKENPHFWSTRPLTQTMIDWSTLGLEKLLTIAELQSMTLKTMGKYDDDDDALQQSTDYVKSLSVMELRYGIQIHVKPYALIGVGGHHIRGLMQRTDTAIFQDSATRKWNVYYKTQDGLNAVLREMGYWF